MDTKFWQEKWKTNKIGFHEGAPNSLLLKYFKDLSLKTGSRLFLPLCGKTLDIHWLLSSGYHVAGAELAETAVEQLFTELGIKPAITREDDMKCYSASSIDIFIGNIFDLSRSRLGPVDAVYDRAALVALPGEVRKRYVQHLIRITNKAPQLLITYEYDQRLIDGPPFSVGRTEINRNYGIHYRVNHMESREVPGGLKGKCASKEEVWLLETPVPEIIQ